MDTKELNKIICEIKKKHGMINEDEFNNDFRTPGATDKRPRKKKGERKSLIKDWRTIAKDKEKPIDYPQISMENNNYINSHRRGGVPGTSDDDPLDNQRSHLPIVDQVADTQKRLEYEDMSKGIADILDGLHSEDPKAAEALRYIFGFKTGEPMTLEKAGELMAKDRKGPKAGTPYSKAVMSKYYNRGMNALKNNPEIYKQLKDYYYE